MANYVRHENGLHQFLFPPSHQGQACENTVQIISASHFPTSTRTSTSTRPSARTLPRRSKVQFQYEEVFAEGSLCSVRKHARLGCAVVNFESESLRDAVLLYFQTDAEKEVAAWQRDDLTMTAQKHFDKSTNEYDRTGLYIAWGREAEKTAPIPVQFIRERFDLIASKVSTLSCNNCAPTPGEVPRSRFFQECGDAAGF
eukprot:TRINITY_DN8822_c0_g3_i1.p1 TRINITY_DN8822_c0_g3~~TRINITY_DN8822_c0_g3_i1.p1  ORF type:complete len:199 (-),score=24.57 TRINITY_DN8822_c0_g3_i1:282-878(-)